MAEQTNDDNLRGLISIRQQLASNTDEIHNQVREMGLLGTEFNNVLTLGKGLNSVLSETEKMYSESTRSLFTAEKINKNIKTLYNQQKIIKETLAVTEARMSRTAKADLDVVRMSRAIQEERNKEIEKSAQLIASQTLTAQEELEHRKSIFRLNRQNEKTEALILQKSASKVVQQALLLDLQKESVEKAIGFSKAMRDAPLSFKELLASVSKVSNTLGRMDMVKGLAKGLGVAGGFSAAFKSLIDTAFEVDTSLTNISKNSGTTAEFSKSILQNYTGVVKSISDYDGSLKKSLLTVTSLLKAQQELQASTNQMGLYTLKSVEDQTYLTTQLGLQAEEAAKIQQSAMFTGKTTEQVTDDVYKQVAGLNSQYKIRLSGRNVLKDVAKIEGVLAVNYKNNPTLIAKAVAQAKALGTSLEQAAAASNSLLDFESSISNELEAELLTGKRFNLEKARSLALDGDSAGAAKEMLANIGSLTEFQKQNVIARQAEAKAIGMTVDELSNALRTQELMKNVSLETKKAIAESGDASKYNAQLNAATNATEMKAAESRVSKQIEFEKSMERVREQVGILASGPLIGFLNTIIKLTENTWALKAALVGAAAVMAAMAASSIVTAISMTVATGGANVIGAATAAGVIGGAGLLAGLGAAAVLNDGLISPSGQIMISTPEGMIKPNKNDSIITTTDPGSLLNGGGSGRQEQLLSAILDAVRQPGGVYMDSTKVGTTLGQSYNAYA